VPEWRAEWHAAAFAQVQPCFLVRLMVTQMFVLLCANCQCDKLLINKEDISVPATQGSARQQGAGSAFSDSGGSQTGRQQVAGFPGSSYPTVEVSATCRWVCTSCTSGSRLGSAAMVGVLVCPFPTNSIANSGSGIASQQHTKSHIAALTLALEQQGAVAAY
jgi:hypothetical protein